MYVVRKCAVFITFCLLILICSSTFGDAEVSPDSGQAQSESYAHRFSLGLFPIAPTAVTGTGEGDEGGSLGPAALLALGGFVRYDWAASRRVFVGAEFSAYGSGGAIDRWFGVTQSSHGGSYVLTVYRLGGGVRNRVAAFGDHLELLIGLDAGIVFAQPTGTPYEGFETQDPEMAAGALGIFVDPLTLELHILIPSTRWRVGVRFETEFSMLRSVAGNDSSHLVIVVGRTALFASVAF